MITITKDGITKPKNNIVSLGEFNIQEPKSVKSTLQDPLWKSSMQVEFTALINNKACSLVLAPKNIHIIGNKWLFRVKTLLDGSLEKRKSRVVTKGYDQTHGFDFSETFSLVIKQVIIQIILTIALSKG